jgi:hypothetical protein
MYEYLRSWTGVAVRPAPGALKNTGVINELLLGRRPVRSALEKREAANTFTGLMNEFDMKLINGMAQGPLYRLLTLTAAQQATFVKDQIYVSPCFEAYSKDRLVPGGNFAAANTRFVIIDKTVPGPDLADFNAAQKEILIRPGTLWAVSAKRTNGAVLEIGLTYIGTTAADRTRAEAIARKKGIA